MNVYDFDETIYDGDSTRDFVFYLVKKYPKTLLVLPKVGIKGIRYVLKNISKTEFKTNVYSMFKYIPNIDKELELFVDNHMHCIKRWYIEQQKEDDVIISASPEFLLQPFMDKLGIRYLIASKVNKFTGEYRGLNCYGEEKVVRFDQELNRNDIDKFYSDSYSDDPMAKLAKQAFLVKGNQLVKW
ncbi:MAG: HAD-IB family phosphatase [Anaerorhabdus sp.]|uniref:HAD-IB family phosphatase n=1 Tax=Anaerorhabdus sp. TaxID=1872524 RepID=UPI002FCAC4EC